MNIDKNIDLGIDVDTLAQQIDIDTQEERMKRAKDIDVRAEFSKLLESKEILDVFIRLKDK